MIEVYQDFLDPDLYKDCYNFAQQSWRMGTPNNFRTHFQNAPRELLGDSFPIMIQDLREGDLYNRLVTNVRNKLGNYKLSYLCFYYWTRFSHMGWHTDDDWKGGVTIYLNEKWERNWGGMFVYEDGSEIKGIVPKPNLAVAQLDGVPHAVTPITWNGDIRYTIQFFIN